MNPQYADRAYTMRTVEYGPSEYQVGDLYLPIRMCPPVVCLIHGGFWRMPYGRDELSPVACDLASRGFAVWNVEYRRLGAPQGGWPETLQDIATAIDHLSVLAAEGTELNLYQVVVAGHSAGGHLALWSAARGPQQGILRKSTHVHPVAAVGLAAVADLTRTYALSAGNNAVAQLLDGSPEEQPQRYAASSPIALLPLGVRQLIVHGTADEALPVELARDYVQAARAAGDNVQYCELPGGGHMDYLDPTGEAHAALCRWLERVTDDSRKTPN